MPIAVSIALLSFALAAALAVRPWRLLRGGELATPLLATLALLPWLWAWPALAGMPLALQWSAAPLVVLLLGWPLAIPVLIVAGFSAMLTAGAGFAQALTLTLWSGVLPATAVLLLGHLVRRALGTHPVAYLLGRAFAVPLVALLACSVGAAAFGHGYLAHGGQVQVVAAVLLALGEAAWTCAVASALVSCRPRWLATWSDSLYLGRPMPVRAQTNRPRR
ncbi:MAG: putative rane protein [Ramlibacter sp.]|nr:putative rane protein [Ramlibacter sp.]